MPTTVDTEELERKVKEMYRAVAEHLLDRIPTGAIESFAGVGYFFDLAALEPGESVIDLGSGSGMDVFCAAQAVGAEGRVVGVDFTTEQLEKARRLAGEDGLAQVEVREGRIDALPDDGESFDCVISNGVINLSPQKERVFAEAARVLRPGGRLAIADIVSKHQLKDSTVADADLWASCIGGAAQEDAYRTAIKSAGLEIEEIRENPYEFISDRARDASAKYGVKSISLLATK
jgi:arsenite methyltransferase